MQWTLSILAVGMAIVVSGTRFAASDDKFIPVFFDKSERLEIRGRPTEVFHYFEPKWRKFMYPWWDLKQVWAPSDGSLLGASFRVLPPGHGKEDAVFVTVTHFDPNAKEIHYTIMWGDFELQKIEIACEANGDGKTWAKIRTMTLGLTPQGNKAVTQYSRNRGEEAGNARYAEGLNKYLKTESDE